MSKWSSDGLNTPQSIIRPRFIPSLTARTDGSTHTLVRDGDGTTSIILVGFLLDRMLGWRPSFSFGVSWSFLGKMKSFALLEERCRSRATRACRFPGYITGTCKMYVLPAPPCSVERANARKSEKETTAPTPRRPGYQGNVLLLVVSIFSHVHPLSFNSKLKRDVFRRTFKFRRS